MSVPEQELNLLRRLRRVSSSRGTSIGDIQPLSRSNSVNSTAISDDLSDGETMTTATTTTTTPAGEPTASLRLSSHGDLPPADVHRRKTMVKENIQPSEAADHQKSKMDASCEEEEAPAPTPTGTKEEETTTLPAESTEEQKQRSNASTDKTPEDEEKKEEETNKEEEGDDHKVRNEKMEKMDVSMDESESISMVRMMLNLENKEDRKSSELFDQMGGNRRESASHEEMAMFLATNHSLWAMLSLNFGLPKEQSTRVATEVAMVLATGCDDRAEAMKQPLSKEQFKEFRQKYVVDKEGAQEFFLRAVFATFDKGKDNALCEKELDKFLDVFYLGSGVFEGPTTLDLPPKEGLRQVLLEQFDTNDKGEKQIPFEKMQMLIKTADGTSSRLAFTDEMENIIEDSIRGGSLRGNPGDFGKHVRRRKKMDIDMGEFPKMEGMPKEADALYEDDETEQGWDFCVWLDKLFSPSSYVDGKRVDGRETLCMRLSRHGSQRSICGSKQGSEQEQQGL